MSHEVLNEHHCFCLGACVVPVIPSVRVNNAMFAFVSSSPGQAVSRVHCY